MYDRYTFIDDEESYASQWLGFYDTTSNYVGRNFFLGTLVQNYDYTVYQKRAGRGRDFDIFTKVKEVPINHHEIIA